MLDTQLNEWTEFLNEWGGSAFILFLACLGTGEHKHLCALLSGLFLCFGYWKNRGRFPVFIQYLRNKRTPEAMSLENEIWKDHFFYKLLNHFPLILGLGTLGSLIAWPAEIGNWSVYLTFLQHLK